MIKLLLVFLLLSFLSLSIFSSELSVIQKSEDSTSYYVGHQESGVWRLDVFIEKKGELQEFDRRINFKSRMALENFLSRLKISNNKFPEKQGEVSFRKSNVKDASLYTELEGDYVWKEEHSWSSDWEKKFSLWVVLKVDKHFFKKHNIETDCADVAYSLRWIFARINKLPMVNRLQGSRKYFSHLSMKREWRALRRHKLWHKDQRFLAALKYLLENTYTHSLMRDSYPVALTKEGLSPGAFHLEIKGMSGHTRVIGETYYNGGTIIPIVLLSSDLPKKVRVLRREGFASRRPSKKGKFGFYRLKWPKEYKRSSRRWRLVDSHKHPLYSEEQFSINALLSSMVWANNFAFGIYKKILPNLNPIPTIKYIMNGVVLSFKYRVKVVKDGVKYCSSHGCSPRRSGWDNFGTHSKDKRLGDDIDSVKELVKKFEHQHSELFGGWDRFLDTMIVDLGFKSVSLRKLVDVWQKKRYSSDPRDNAYVRWGIR